MHPWNQGCVKIIMISPMTVPLKCMAASAFLK